MEDISSAGNLIQSLRTELIDGIKALPAGDRLHELYEQLEAVRAYAKVIEVALAQQEMGHKCNVVVRTEGGEWHEAFSYYPDEVNYDTKEFLGLTLDQCRERFRSPDGDAPNT